MNWKSVILTVIFISAFAFLGDAQCSQCKLVAEASGVDKDAEILGITNTTNINQGILYIMAVPYIILMFLFRKQISRLFKGLKKA